MPKTVQKPHTFMNRKTIGKKKYFYFLGRFVPLLHFISDKYVSHTKLSIYLMKKSIYYLTKAEKIVQ